MAFVWKEPKNIWKGEGIYHLTFAVTGRRPLLGSLQPLDASSVTGRRPLLGSLQPLDASSAPISRSYLKDVQRPQNTDGSPLSPKLTTHKATVALTPLGFTLSDQLQRISDYAEGVTLCAKQIMPDHVHVVLWMKKDTGRSIRQIGNGIRIGIKRAAISLGAWSADQGHILEIPFIRTLSHSGQLRQMIDYVHANPDNAWERHQNPQFYTIRRDITHSGLIFDAMGKTRLLDYPERNVIAISRSLTKEQIEAEVNKALFKAHLGSVTYTAAINEGEKAVSKAIREAHQPLVIMMLEGFPAEGTEAARYFHPSGIYHTVCGEGRLLLLAPHQSNYASPTLIANTDAELERKAHQKGLPYHPIPHTSQRWLMIAGNEMLKLLTAPHPPTP